MDVLLLFLDTLLGKLGRHDGLNFFAELYKELRELDEPLLGLPLRDHFQHRGKMLLELLKLLFVRLRHELGLLFRL